MKTFWTFAALLLTPAFLRAAEEVKASHILVRSQDEADLIRNEIMEKGGDRKAFMAAARKHSKDTTTKRAGGALGWFTRQKMVGEFSEATFDLKAGEISQPVKTQYGWHLIILEDRREQSGQGLQRPGQPVNPQATSTPPSATTTGVPPAPVIRVSDPPAAAGPADLAPGVPAAQAGAAAAAAGAQNTAPAPSQPGAKAATPPPAGPPLTTPPAPGPQTPVVTPGTTPPPAAASQTEAPKVQPAKPTLPGRSLKLAIDVKQKLGRPMQTVEVDLMLTNAGSEPQKIFAPDLLPLGFSVANESTPTSPPANWEELKGKKPETPLISLASRRALGGSFTLNDYFKDLPPTGRYRLAWKPQVFFQNLEQVFPEMKTLPDYEAVKAAYNDPRNLTREVVGQAPRLQFRNRDAEVPFSLFDFMTASSGKKYYASMEFDRFPGQPLWIELFADRQVEGVNQFGGLALQGFYDWLALFDVQKGNYLRAGCPRNDGTGVPERTVHAQNAQRIAHEKGTISLLSRTTGAGVKEVGSIFFICRKPHPEWDNDQVPIGKIISGEDLLDRVEGAPGQVLIRKINVVTADNLPTNVAQAAGSAPAAAPPGADSKTAPTAGTQPQVKIKTAKGEVTVDLFEVDAPNTTANFIELVERGFYNPDPNTKKELTFYSAFPGQLLITGSPTNDDRGGPGYRIASETADNKQQHVKGTLTMLLESDPQSGNPVPDSAGSQFMICLQDMPAWNGVYTPFGKVTAGLEVLDKLAQSDKIESVTIVNKRNRPYKARTMPLR